MRFGIVAPVFTGIPELPLTIARRAEELGFDGVFVFDHLFPAGQPQRPALHGPTVLGALAAVTERIALGTLVTRVTLLAHDDLVALFEGLDSLSHRRVIAGLGMGDKAGQPENDAYGLPFPSLRQRSQRLREAARDLRARGIPVWVGGRSALARQTAESDGDAWNVWGASPSEMAAMGGLSVPITWGGPCLIARDDVALEVKRRERPTLGQAGSPGGQGPVGTVEGVAEHARSLRETGADWVVYAPPDIGTDPSVIDCLAEVAGQVR